MLFCSGVMGLRWCRRRVDDECVVRGEYGEVGVVAPLDLALVLQPGDQGRPLGHPTYEVDEGVPALPRLGPYCRQAELQRGDPAPGDTEVAAVESLELNGARRVVGDDAVDVAAGQRAPQCLVQWGNSSTPDGVMKHLKPKTPASCNASP